MINLVSSCVKIQIIIIHFFKYWYFYLEVIKNLSFLFCLNYVRVPLHSTLFIIILEGYFKTPFETSFYNSTKVNMTHILC